MFVVCISIVYLWLVISKKSALNTHSFTDRPIWLSKDNKQRIIKLSTVRATSCTFRSTGALDCILCFVYFVPEKTTISHLLTVLSKLIVCFNFCCVLIHLIEKEFYQYDLTLFNSILQSQCISWWSMHHMVICLAIYELVWHLMFYMKTYQMSLESTILYSFLTILHTTLLVEWNFWHWTRYYLHVLQQG